MSLQSKRFRNPYQGHTPREEYLRLKAEKLEAEGKAKPKRKTKAKAKPTTTEAAAEEPTEE